MTTTDTDTEPTVDPDALAAGLAAAHGPPVIHPRSPDEAPETLEHAEARWAAEDDRLRAQDAAERPLPAVHEAPAPVVFTPAELQTLKDTVAASAKLTDAEFDLFVAVCRRTGLDPFQRQIHPVKRYNRSAGRDVMTIQTGIDGYRLVAERTGKMLGQVGPEWCGPDGQWVDVWLDDENPPRAARVGVIRDGWHEVAWGTAKWAEYAAKDRDGKPQAMWANMPTHMLAKCAEALGLRKAFPNEMAGVYTDEEMDQAAAIEASATTVTRPPPPPAEPAPEEVRTEIAGRIMRLPDAARADLATWWEAQITVPVADLNRRQIPKAKAKVAQVEGLVLAGNYGSEAMAALNAVLGAENGENVVHATQDAQEAASEPTAAAEGEWCADCERAPCECPGPEEEPHEASQPSLLDDPEAAPFD